MSAVTELFGKLADWVKRNSRALKITFYILLGIAVIYVASSQLGSFDWAEIKRARDSFHPITIFGLIIAGLFAFTFTGFYDVVGAYFVPVMQAQGQGEPPSIPEVASTDKGKAKPVLSLKTALKIGWQAMALNNFVGLGGLTGGTIRTKAYIAHGVDSKSALRITLSVWIANLLGLFVLLIVSSPAAFIYERAYAIIPLVASIIALLVYLFGYKIKIGKFDLGKTPLGYMPMRGKVWMLLASLADWLGAAIFFLICVEIFIPGAPIWNVIFIYSTATIVGLISFVPSGLGTFDVTALTLFAHTGGDINKLLIAIVFYRLIYYVLPWALASLQLMFETVDRHYNFEVYSRGGQIICTILAAGLIFSGVILILSTLTPEILDRVHELRSWIPKDIMKASRFTTLLIGILLIFLSRGILLRVRRAYLVTVGLLGVGIVTLLLKGLDYEEATILLIFGVLLLLANRYFVAEPMYLGWRSIIWTVLVLVGVPCLVFWIRRNTDLLNAPSTIPDSAHLISHLAVVTFVLVAIVMVAMFTASPEINFVEPSAQDVRDFDKLIEEFGGNEYSHLFYLYDKAVFFNESRTVAFLYYPVRNHMLVLGDPVGNRADYSTALDELLSYCATKRYNVAFYQASGTMLEEYWDRGLAVVKIGEDATVELASVPFVGNKGRKFRRMLNRMKEKGTTFEMWMPPYTQTQIDELRDASRAWLGKRQEMGYSLGFFNPEYIGRTPVAVVRSENRIEGFATVQPVDGKTISVDLMRFRPDAPGGTMDGVFIHLFKWAMECGFTHFYLGMAPMANDGAKVRWRHSDKVVRYIFWLGRSLYNFAGLREYKDKFGPVWHSRYLVYTSQRQLPGIISALLEAVRKPAVIRTIPGAPTEPPGPIGRGQTKCSPLPQSVE